MSEAEAYELQPDTARSMFTSAQETLNECIRQAVKFGEGRTMPDVVGDREIRLGLPSEFNAKQVTDYYLEKGDGLTWQDILVEEVLEALESTPGSTDMVEELIQVAAVCWTWIADIRSRTQ